MKQLNRYSQLIESIFFKYYKEGLTEINFNRDEINEAAEQLGIKLPKNIGDILYAFRYRTPLPTSITDTASEGKEWIIRSTGKAMYQIVLAKHQIFKPSEYLSETKIPDATPGIITKYALTDEQALLAIVRFNRLIDIFTGLTCYSLQSHLRTTVPEKGQVETDEIYIGIDKRGVHYVLPVQAKGGKDKIGVIQIEQDFAVGRKKFPHLICKPIAAQFMNTGTIALFEFELEEGEVRISSEKHYRLTPHENILNDEIEQYKTRIS